jgi:hypothetical protein
MIISMIVLCAPYQIYFLRKIKGSRFVVRREEHKNPVGHNTKEYDQAFL